MAWAELPDDEDYIMRPVIEGMCKYSELKDCTLDLEDVVRMNDSLNIKYENERRASRKASQ